MHWHLIVVCSVLLADRVQPVQPTGRPSLAFVATNHRVSVSTITTTTSAPWARHVAVLRKGDLLETSSATTTKRWDMIKLDAINKIRLEKQQQQLHPIDRDVDTKVTLDRLKRRMTLSTSSSERDGPEHHHKRNSINRHTLQLLCWVFAVVREMISIAA